jgi:hypothetical protein
MSGPSPRYRPVFTADQIADCERLVRRHSGPQAVVYRAKLALLLLAEPTPWTIARRAAAGASTRTGCATGGAPGPRMASAWPTGRGAGASRLSPRRPQPR